MALDDILRAMERQAQDEITRLQAKAEAEAAAIIATAEEEAQGIKARHLASIMPRVQQERSRLLSEAKLSVLREVTAAREALLEEAFTKAQTELARWREKPQYPRHLARLVHEVVDELGRELSIVVDARDEDLIRRIIPDLGIQPRMAIGLQTAGGLEASTPDGRITVVNTIEVRLQRSQQHLRRVLASMLSAEDLSCKVNMATAMPASEP